MIYYDVSRWSEFDIYLFKEGTHYKLYEKFGSHSMQRQKEHGVYFSVWAPHAKSVSVVGDWNGYDATAHPLQKRDDGSGIWEGFITQAKIGHTYKYHIVTPYDTILLKADPYAVRHEKPPKSASIIWELVGYSWNDKEWMQRRASIQNFQKPISIYEVHLGSWRKDLKNYVDLANALVEYVRTLGFTHIELLPITEHPFDGSWGYQVSGYFAPTSRFGTPQEFMEFVDIMHRNGIGVVLDWVPSHFVTDGHGLVAFDGEALYEYKDPRLGYHPEWKSAVFDYGKNEVRSFLISSAFYWLEQYHIDGLRVDGVASMLYLDYARKEGEWVPNIYGSNENLEAISFLKQFNEAVYGHFDGIFTAAEESTAFPKVTYPVYDGGLGFGYKWNMGWMHDTLEYFKKDPIYRKHHHHQITFSIVYAFSENFILPLSHDEVVHMKGSLINKMPGDDNQKHANLRTLFAYMFAHPGKKLLFMGAEMAQYKEWDYKDEIQWELLSNPRHKGIFTLISDLNALYKNYPALYQYDTKPKGFEWLEADDYEHNVLAFLRKSDSQTLLIFCNFAGIVQEYRLGVPLKSRWQEIFCSQDSKYNGWDIERDRELVSEQIPSHGKEQSIFIKAPALGVLYYELEGNV